MRLIFVFTLLFFNQAQAQALPFTLFEENGKVGVKDDHGNILIPAHYDALGWPHQEFAIQKNVVGYKSGALWGLISIDNKIITSPEFATLSYVGGNLLIASKKSQQSFRIKNGCIDINGKIIIPFEYDGIEINSLRAIVYNRIQNKIQFGVVDLDNKIIIPSQYQSIVPIGSLRFAVENFEEKIALFNDQGKQLTGFTIDRIAPFKNNFAILYEGNSQGLIDRNGTIHVAPTYREIKINDDGTIQAKKQNEWSILTAENKLLTTLALDSIEILSVNRYGLQNAGAVKLVDGEFNSLSEDSYASIQSFQHQYAIFFNERHYGVLHLDGTIAFPAIYDKLIKDGEYFISMQIENAMAQWSLLNEAGEIKNQKTYDEILPFNGKFFPVKKRGYWGAMDTDGKEIISCVFDSLVQLEDPFIVVKFHNQYGVIDLEENWRVIPQPGMLSVVHPDRYFQMNGTTTYLKSFTGTLIYFTENPIVAKEDYLEETVSNGSIWKIDFDGRIIHRQLPPESPYEEIYPESEGLRAIKKNDRYGFIDDRGRLRIANRYEDAKAFTENLAAIKILNRWGFIDHQEKIVIQPVYDKVTSFSKGLAIVTLKSKFGIIDITGKVLLKPTFDSLTPLPSGRFLVKQNNAVGLVDTDGNLIIQPNYDLLNDLDNGYVIIKKNDKYGLMTTFGVSTIPLLYDFITYDAINNRYFALKKTDWEKIYQGESSAK